MKKVKSLITLLDIRTIAKEEALKPWKSAGRFLFFAIGFPLVGLVLDTLVVGIANLTEICVGSSCFAPAFTILGGFFGAIIALEVI